MATTSGSSVSAQYRKRGRNVGGKSGAASDGERREGGRGPGRRAAFVGKGGGNVKRKWRPNLEQKKFQGSAKEGQGFALWRKNKVQSDYKKLQRKQKTNTKEVTYSDHYPEHLKHLYLAEEERLKREEKQRRSAKKTSETVEKQTEEVVIPKKKFKKKTSNQKAKEEYEQVQLKRAKKREEAENNRRKREEALRLHKQRRMETFKVLCSKTKKGQPNFNVQMDYLLKKIQSKS